MSYEYKPIIVPLTGAAELAHWGISIDRNPDTGEIEFWGLEG